MSDSLSTSRLRANLYRILDQVLESGEPVEIERKGRLLRIVADSQSKLDTLQPHEDYLNGSPDDLVHIDW